MKTADDFPDGHVPSIDRAVRICEALDLARKFGTGTEAAPVPAPLPRLPSNPVSDRIPPRCPTGWIAYRSLPSSDTRFVADPETANLSAANVAGAR